MLLEDGTYCNERREAVTPRRGERIVLSRSLCRFKPYVLASGVPKSKVYQAAWLYSEAHAPFAETGKLVVRAPFGAAIWYWDNGRVGAGANVVPEVLTQSPGAGWRVVACMEGYEAQYWEKGCLRGSTWRRRPFNAEQWAAFVLSIDGAERAPDTPPEPIDVRMTGQPAWRPSPIRPADSWLRLERAAVLAAMMLVVLSAFFMGDALRTGGLTAAETTELALLEKLVAAEAAVNDVRDWEATVLSYRDSQRAADVSGVIADAFEVFHRFGLDADAWSADQARFTAQLPVNGAALPLRDLVAALESKPLLCNVVPSLAPGDGSITISAGLAVPSDSFVCTTTTTQGVGE